jgi:hypothetical protein
MTPGEWTTIAGFVTGIAGAIWGYGYGRGKDKTTIEAHGETLAKVTEEFAKCQARGLECSSGMKILVENSSQKLAELRGQLAAHQIAVQTHHEKGEIHTTAEWRINVMNRLDRMEESVNTKLDRQTAILMGRIEGLEKVIKNGGK